jgi:signal peptidase I
MEPLIAKGDSVLVFPLPLGARTWFGKTPALRNIHRGELVIVDPDPIPSVDRFFYVWDSLARFFTLQRYSPLAQRYGAAKTSPGLYRVIGLPGDKIRRNTTVYEIQSGSGGAYLTEQSLADRPYELKNSLSSEESQAVENLAEVIELGSGEYFVEGDNRKALNGSALWGPIGIERISGRVIIVYWPIKHIDIL